ncbi:MAG: hypothetical protein Q8T08_08775 [Ignavibacteria bacterium]|nr:hypothetical protein [Ignavibacteria bacterium]
MDLNKKVLSQLQDDCLKQKSIKRSGNWQKVMIFPVENANSGKANRGGKWF